MPPIHFGSATYKNLQINNKIDTSDLYVHDDIYIQNTSLSSYILKQKEFSYGIQGVLNNNNGLLKQIVTPSDLSHDYLHLYKHVLNNCHLISVNLFDNQNNRVHFDNLSIVLFDSKLQTTKNYLNYNSLTFSNQYVHNNNTCEYIDIQGNLSNVTHGHLLWSYFIDKVIINYTLTTHQFIFKNKALLVLNETFQFNITQQGFSTNDGDVFFIKSKPNNVDVNFVENPHKNGNIQITPRIVHYETNTPFIVTMSIKDANGNDYNCDFNIEFYVIKDALIVLSENQEPYFIGNSKFDQYSIYNSTNKTLYVHEFNVSTDKVIENNTTLIEYQENVVLSTGDFNIGYSYTISAPQTFDNTIPLKSLPSSNTNIIDFTFLPYTYKSGLSNIHYQSFLNSPMEYFEIDYGVYYEFNSHKYVYYHQNQITYNHKSPVAHISYKPSYSTETSWISFYKNDFYDNTMKRNSLLFLPFEHQSFQISILAGDKTTLNNYQFQTQYTGLSLLFLDSQDNIQLTVNQTVFVNEISFEYSNIQHFSLKFISFREIDDSFLDNLPSIITINKPHVFVNNESFQLLQLEESNKFLQAYHYKVSFTFQTTNTSITEFDFEFRFDNVTLIQPISLY